ncbi:hypothetical protein CASFOL_021258 [Castilleja foliolosa]|uniref:Histone deacetylase domain-containing protein n=1 Tax=Castilleja foliolosa TaxID=1961234 RepID=A0ABD3CYP4_9LAMI
MTVSFHKFGKFFPGTGHIKDIGVGAGKYYSLNVPKVMEVYNPEAVVLQCGADSLGGDRLGKFNLSVKGHADCLRYLRTFNVPLMLLGGGGYNKLPYSEYLEYFGPNYTLHSAPSNMANLNKTTDLENMRIFLLDQISRLQHVPSVQFQTPPPVIPVPDQMRYDSDFVIHCKPNGLCEIVGALKGAQEEDVKAAGFGGMLRISDIVFSSDTIV